MKRIIALFLTLALCLFSLIPVTAADALNGKVEHRAVSLLSSLEILRGDENGDYLLDKSVNRAEFTAFVIRILDLENIANSVTGPSGFVDVAEDHWGKGVIRTAAEMHLIEGVGNGYFEPDRGVTFQEAIKILVSALGYQAVAEKNGGFPGGYTKIANQIGVMKKLSLSGNASLNRLDTCLLIYNALSAKVFNEYADQAGKTMLEEYLHLSPITGVITETPGYQRASRLQAGYVKLNGVLYLCSDPFVDDYIGYNATCYVREEAGEFNICYIEPKSNTQTVVVEAEDILPSTTVTEFHYIDEKDQEESLRMAGSLSVFYNGVILPDVDVTNAMLRPATGCVSLRDGDGDGLVETVLLEVYSDYVVNYITDDVVYAKFGKMLDVSNADSVRIFKNGAEIALTDIANGDILSVMQSRDQKMLKIVASNEGKSGYIINIEKLNGGQNIYTLENTTDGMTTFSLSKDYRDMLAAHHIDAVSLSVNPDRLLKVYYNAYGLVSDVGVLKQDEEFSYGYLNGAQKIGGSLTNAMAIEVLTVSNRFEVFESKSGEKVRYGRPSGSSYTITPSEPAWLVTKLQSKELIKYKLDKDGYLVEVHRASNILSTDYFSCISDDGKLINYRDNVFDNKYYIDQNTAVFSVNSKYAYIMSAGKYTTFLNNGASKYCAFYDVEGSYAKAILFTVPYVNIYDDSEDTGYEVILDYVNSPIFYIDSIQEKLAEDGEVYMCLNGYQDGEFKTLLVADELKINSETRSNLRPGIAIQYEDNTIHTDRAMTSHLPKQLILFKTVFDFNNPPSRDIYWEYKDLKSSRSQITTCWGPVTLASESYCTLETDVDLYTASLHENTMILRYDSEKKQFVKEKMGSINTGQNVFIRQRYQNTREAVIY